MDEIASRAIRLERYSQFTRSVCIPTLSNILFTDVNSREMSPAYTAFVNSNGHATRYGRFTAGELLVRVEIRAIRPIAQSCSEIY